MSKVLINDLRRRYKEETGNDWLNSQGEPDIEYVQFLEQIAGEQSSDTLVRQLYQTLGLLSSMISSGEEHTDYSINQLSLARSCLRKIEVRLKHPDTY